MSYLLFLPYYYRSSGLSSNFATMETSYVTSKGQVVVPARIRRKFGIKEGTRLNFHEETAASSCSRSPANSSARSAACLKPGRASPPPWTSSMPIGRRSGSATKPKMRTTVFDSSAVLALLLEQPGADLVEDLLAKAADADRGHYHRRGQLGGGLLGHRAQTRRDRAGTRPPVWPHDAAGSWPRRSGAGRAGGDTGAREFKSVEKEIKIVWLG